MKPHEYNPKATLISALVIGGLIVWSYNMKPKTLPNIHLQGETMGTTYNVKVSELNKAKEDATELKLMIDATLEEVNKQMSTWDPTSDISVFNKTNSTAECTLPAGFLSVVKIAKEVHRLSGGAFDPTIKPLIDAWGFGEKIMRAEPTTEKINSLKGSYGFEQILLTEKGMRKVNPDLTMNLSAIAKGYGVDQIFELISSKGYNNIFVEIGGEVRVKGKPFNADAWRVGIENPDLEGSFNKKLFEGKVLSLNDMAVASSGSYRNFRTVKSGQQISHIIDPRTGFPVVHSMVSVSIVHKHCVMADALATALFVLGPEEGMALVQKTPGVEAFMIFEKDGTLSSIMSKGFKKYLGE